MIVSKTNIKGIDLVIDSLQNELFARISANWLLGVDYQMYPRANKLLAGNEVLPVVSTDEQDYNLTLFDDNFAATSFFVPNDIKNYSYEAGGTTQELSLIFQVDLKTLYDSNERLDEVFNAEVLGLIDRHLKYVVAGEVVVSEGVDNVYSDFTLSGQTRQNIIASDISHRHVVKFSFDVFYKNNICYQDVSIVAPPVIVSVNSDLMTVAPSGSTVNVIIKDSLGVEQGVRVGETFEYIVPAGVALVRIYNQPAYSGADDRGQDYDTYWRMVNNIGNYTQPMAGVAMRLAWGRYDLLHPIITIGNVFGNLARWTGTTGGYLDFDTGIYYTVGDIVTTRSLAFPDGLAVDHWMGGVIPIDATILDSWYDWLSLGATMTIGAFTGFYAVSVPEGIALGTWGDITLPYTNSPLFKWGTGAKLTGDSYPLSGTNNAMVLQAYGHMTSTPKANANKIIFYKPIDINTIFG